MESLSQFVFGEFVTPSESNVYFHYPVDSPFSFRFPIHSHDYYRRVAPQSCSVIPFVVTDTFDDNNAELLLRPDLCEYNLQLFPEAYSKIISMSLQERVSSLCGILKKTMIETGSECILVLSDGLTIEKHYQECAINQLEQMLMDLLCASHPFHTATLWIKHVE